MALALSQAAALKPEIRLAQAISEYEAALDDSQKAKFRSYRAQQPPTEVDVFKLTAEIDQNQSQKRISRQCVGPRLTNLLQSVQQFSIIVDLVVAGSQNLLAAGIWGVIRMSLQVAVGFSSSFDKLSALFMDIGRTCPRYQELGLLYPRSQRLQKSLCEYFVVLCRLCRRVVLFFQKSALMQLSSTVLKPFEGEFGVFRDELRKLAGAIREDVSLASKQAQSNEINENSKFRELTSKLSKTTANELKTAREWKQKDARLKFLDACSKHDFQAGWKRERKKGSTRWMMYRSEFKEWKVETSSCAIWCKGPLGSGKTVLAANVVENLILSGCSIAYFFCFHDNGESLTARTIVGSLVRQLLARGEVELAENSIILENFPSDVDGLVDLVLRLLPSKPGHHFLILDGLDECDEKEIETCMRCLKKLLESDQTFKLIWTSRPEFRSKLFSTFENRTWEISFGDTTENGDSEIADYIQVELERRLESGSLCLGDAAIISNIHDRLLAQAQGMFLWVALQLDVLCQALTDDDILAALDDLPENLADTYDRIMQKTKRTDLSNKIFALVSAAHTPLDLNQVQEAVNVEIGSTDWNQSKMINNMQRVLSHCGSLIILDEEDSTLRFTHHSVKEHLTSEMTRLKRSEYYIDTSKAELHMGEICVSYLSSNIFERRMTRTRRTTSTHNIDIPSQVIEQSLTKSQSANKLALRILKARRTASFDLVGHLESIDRETRPEPTPEYFFLDYAKKFWLLHTTHITEQSKAYDLWQRLVERQVPLVILPWDPMSTSYAMRMVDPGFCEYIETQNHQALLNLLSLYHFAVDSLHLPSHQASDVFRLLRLWTSNNRVKNMPHTFLQHALLYGIAAEHKDFLTQLILVGANPKDLTASAHEKFLRIASRAPYSEIIEALVDRGADTVARDGRFSSVLHFLVIQSVPDGLESSRLKIMEKILQHGADVDFLNGGYGTALQEACLLNDEAVASLLLRYNANVNQPGNLAYTALRAADEESEDKPNARLPQRATIGALDGRASNYDTALHAACYTGHTSMVTLLLNHGADVNLEGGRFGTALQAACLRGRLNISLMLLEHGAKVNSQAGGYDTALQAACVSGKIEIVNTLLKHGADVNLQGGEYGTALQAACTNGHEMVAQELLAHGADVKLTKAQYGSAKEALIAAGVDRDLRESGFV